jgi:2-polyprenyl-6-methoxyphenol hydroxylase-like FAD-dependent oxidoreductase
MRPYNVESVGALMLAPNALRILDQIGAYSQIRGRGYNFDEVQFKDKAENIIDCFPMGSEEKYGYQALRIPRQVVLEELEILAKDREIPINYGKKLVRVLEETQDRVAFQFTDGSVAVASVLIGADGLRSAVRGYICPNIKPTYSGQLAVSALIDRTHLRLPSGANYHLPAVIYGNSGGYLMLPQSFDGSDIVIGTQKAYPEQDRTGWAALAADKNQLSDLLRLKESGWSDVIQSALENISPDSISIWPYYSIQEVPHWTSVIGRVLLLGDAAHAIPPTAGQGACQAFEDSLTVAILLAPLKPFTSLVRELRLWEEIRKDRIKDVARLTMQLGNNRLPQAERDQLPRGKYWASSEQPDLHWLYQKNIGEDVMTHCKSISSA